ncbi:tankyrase-2-like isoform X1 [Gossypium australe]|uniref:Tankyrase-2-like isoform X1 n=1 Tax=Gossypium australe TaxID=47621 RepID=A0A5B6V952_9ROSI|nr:tankyrase-2-like isoform X1 [Gossypium australe]
MVLGCRLDRLDFIIECGLDANATDRVLLRSSKPSLYTNIDCNAVSAAVICRQISIVRSLLQAGIKTDLKVRVGAWSWDIDTGEETRVGARLAEAYSITWCAVEYFEVSGSILRLLLQHISPNNLHYGRTLIHHAILCKNVSAVEVLLNYGADIEFPVKTTSKTALRSIHLSAKLGFVEVLQCLIVAVQDVILAGKTPQSSNPSVFSPLMFTAGGNEIEAFKKLLERADGNLALMIAASGGHLEAFELLLRAGANIKLSNKYGDTSISLLELNQKGDVFDQLMLEYAHEDANGPIGFYALHRAAKRGDLNLVHILTRRGYDIHPLTLIARGGYGRVCELLISCGAKCDVKNARHETTLLLARKKGYGNDTKIVILNELARALVVDGSQVKKHTRGGKGSPHSNTLRMMETRGIPRWGKSSRRNVICKATEVGPGENFRWNRRRKFDVEESGMFHVVTTKNNKVHFVYDGGIQVAELWARGILLVTSEAIFGKPKQV